VVDPPPHLYRRGALEAGRDPDTVARAIRLASQLRSRDAFPVLTLAHLAHLTGATWHFLRDVVARRRDPYDDITRPKRDGRTRPISSPEPVLMDVQRWLLHNVVSALGVHPASYAYEPGRSIVRCAEQHVGARWLVKLDVHDFFASVGERRVYRMFAGLGYPRLLSLELARLCTRVSWDGPVPRTFWRHRDGAPYAVTMPGVLPQGAPTSGRLANVAMLSVDAELAELAASQGLVYTRYSDDLTLSAAAGFTRREAARVVKRASAALARGGFRTHRAKTRVVPPGARKIVLGLGVHGDGVRLRAEYKRRLHDHVRGVAKFGLAEHAAHRHFRSVLSMIDHIDGGIAFAKDVEPVFAAQIRERWERALEGSGYPAAS
jgi:RNA-directed DNA polymerase